MNGNDSDTCSNYAPSRIPGRGYGVSQWGDDWLLTSTGWSPTLWPTLSAAIAEAEAVERRAVVDAAITAERLRCIAEFPSD